MARLVALLRGINLGAKRRVPMADLRELMDELGYTDVRTVLQSGNVVFTGTKTRRAKQARRRRSKERFGFEIDVVLRTDRRAAERSSTTTRSQQRPTTPSATSSSSPRARCHPRLTRTGARTSCTSTASELYAWCPDGMQNSKLMKALGKPGIADTVTFRNMATVRKLLD